MPGAIEFYLSRPPHLLQFSSSWPGLIPCLDEQKPWWLPGDWPPLPKNKNTPTLKKESTTPIILPPQKRQNDYQLRPNQTRTGHSSNERRTPPPPLNSKSQADEGDCGTVAASSQPPQQQQQPPQQQQRQRLTQATIE